MQSRQHLRRLAAIFSFIASVTLTCAWAGSQNENLPNFQKVDDHVFRGAQPAQSGFSDLAQLGIKTVIDLRDIGEHSQADEQKTVTDLGMRYVSIPMKGMSAPTGDQIAAVLTLFNDPASEPVFVHCKRGADRTGTVIAIYRISHDGWENHKALSEAKSLGMGFYESAMQHYVMDYKPAAAVVTASTTSTPVPAAAAAAAK